MGAMQLQRSETTDFLVLRWRIEQLVRAGFRGVDAEALAERRDVDLHQAIRLLRNGCTPELALAILL
jgi:hypothetical protein